MNSRVLDGRIRDDGSRAARLAGSDMTSEQIADELYLGVFSRFPSEAERDYVLGLLKDVEKRRAVVEDLMWAMVNSPEFTIRN